MTGVKKMTNTEKCHEQEVRGVNRKGKIAGNVRLRNKEYQEKDDERKEKK